MTKHKQESGDTERVCTRSPTGSCSVSASPHVILDFSLFPLVLLIRDLLILLVFSRNHCSVTFISSCYIFGSHFHWLLLFIMLFLLLTLDSVTFSYSFKCVIWGHWFENFSDISIKWYKFSFTNLAVASRLWGFVFIFIQLKTLNFPFDFFVSPLSHSEVGSLVPKYLRMF